MASRSVNKVILVGHLGRDAETKFTPAGVAVTKFSVATNRRWKDQQSGEWKEETDWANVVLWRQENLANYLTKGKQVYVEGRLQTRSYDDKDGKKQYMTEVVAEDVILLGGRGGEGDGGFGSRRAGIDAAQRTPSGCGGRTDGSRESRTTTYRFKDGHAGCQPSDWSGAGDLAGLGFFALFIVGLPMASPIHMRSWAGKLGWSVLDRWPVSGCWASAASWRQDISSSWTSTHSMTRKIRSASRFAPYFISHRRELKLIALVGLAISLVQPGSGLVSASTGRAMGSVAPPCARDRLGCDRRKGRKQRGGTAEQDLEGCQRSDGGSPGLAKRSRANAAPSEGIPKKCGPFAPGALY